MLKYLRGISLTLSLAFTSAACAETNLIFATAFPPESRISIEIHEKWVEQVNKDGAGVLKVDIRHGFNLAGPANFYDRVKDGVVPISWGSLGAVGGQFPLMGALELPFQSDDPVAAAVALWRLYEEGVFDEEFRDVVPLYMTVFPYSSVHLRKPLDNLDSLNGASVIVSGRTNGHTIESLGGVPLSINAADSYEAIRRGTADGRLIPWSAFTVFHMQEVTSYSIEGPFGTAVFAVLMNRKVWDSLTDEQREILMRNSGEQQTRRIAGFTVKYFAEERAKVVDGTSHQAVSPDAEQLAAWSKATEEVLARWNSETKGGQEMLARFQELSAEVRKELAAGK